MKFYLPHEKVAKELHVCCKSVMTENPSWLHRLSQLQGFLDFSCPAVWAALPTPSQTPTTLLVQQVALNDVSYQGTVSQEPQLWKSSNVSVKLRLDNTTAISYINNQGGTRSPSLMSLTLNMWNWCFQCNIFNSWCNRRKVNPISASITEILIFLGDQFDNDLQYGVMGGKFIRFRPLLQTY